MVKEEVCEWKYGYEEKLCSCSRCSSSDVFEEEEISPSCCCSTRKIVRSECKIVENFIKNCRKWEQIHNDRVGKPVEELVKSTTDYRNKEDIERNAFDCFNRVLEKVGVEVSPLDKVFRSRKYNDGGDSSSFRQKIPIESHLDEKEKKTSGEQSRKGNDKEESVYSEFSSKQQIKDV